jgi:hypothetical protein
VKAESSSRLGIEVLWEGKSRWDGPEYACIRGEACDRDADVIVDAEHLLLVRRELSARALDAGRAKVSDMAIKSDACARGQRGASLALALAIAGNSGAARRGEISMARTLRARSMA